MLCTIILPYFYKSLFVLGRCYCTSIYQLGKKENSLLSLKLFLFFHQRSLKDSDVDSFIEEVLVNGQTWTTGVPEVLTGSFVFVCSHGSRDKRCGVCGPVLIEKFKEEIGSRGLSDQVVVNACSHVGGHKYAGNLIIYSPGHDGKITGHW